jgi:methylated-DNA-[protein]-cysteine S-methyltransferase
MSNPTHPNPTNFQMRVYHAVQGIPCGRVATYKSVAACIGCASCRAVGQALRKNPFSPRVPCHRVIASDLSPGGFQGEKGGAALHRKLKLLNTEGVLFKNGKLADTGHLIELPKP